MAACDGDRPAVDHHADRTVQLSNLSVHDIIIYFRHWKGGGVLLREIRIWIMMWRLIKIDFGLKCLSGVSEN